MTTHRSVCPYDCPDTCGLLVEVENGQAVKVSGDPDHPMTRGLLCPKMLHYERTVHSPQRLTTPLLRTGAKGSGEFAPISWEEAISRICDQWQQLIATHGGECILPYSYAGTMGLVQRNAGHPFFHKLGASRLERTICSPAKDAGWKAVMGDTPAMEPEAMLESDLVILWGINAVATSIHAMRDAREARRRGARVWAIDTYRTPTCDAVDEAFIVKPGGDGALALGMLHVMARDGLADRAFIAANVHGFDEFEQTVLPGCTPELMSEICGLPAATIVRLAHEFALAHRPFVRLGSGLTRYGNGAMTVRSIACLPAISGAQNSAKRAKTRVQFSQWSAAIEQFRQEYGYYPAFTSGRVNAGAGADLSTEHIFHDTLAGRRRNGAGLPTGGSAPAPQQERPSPWQRW